MDSEPFNPQESQSDQQLPITPFNKKDQKLAQTTQVTTEMEEAEKEINLRNSNLTYRLSAYNPNTINEVDVGEKIYLRKLDEVEQIQEDVVNRVDKYF